MIKMIRIELISELNAKVFKDALSEFLSGLKADCPEFKLIDIKFQTANYKQGDILYSALVIYDNGL